MQVWSVGKSTQVPQICKVREEPSRCRFVSTHHHGLGCLGVPSENDPVLKPTRANTSSSARRCGDRGPSADPTPAPPPPPPPPPRMCVRACVSACHPGPCDPHPGARAAPRPPGHPGAGGQRMRRALRTSAWPRPEPRAVRARRVRAGSGRPEAAFAEPRDVRGLGAAAARRRGWDGGRRAAARTLALALAL